MKTRSESERVASYLKATGTTAPEGYASGGRVKPQTTIQINIEREKPQQPDPMALAAMAKPPVVNPQPAPPPMAGPGMAPPGAGPMPGMNRGGRAGYAKGGAVKSRATAIPMDAGAMSGDGRQNKAISQAKASGQKQPVKGTFRTAK